MLACFTTRWWVKSVACRAKRKLLLRNSPAALTDRLTAAITPGESIVALRAEPALAVVAADQTAREVSFPVENAFIKPIACDIVESSGVSLSWSETRLPLRDLAAAERYRFLDEDSDIQSSSRDGVLVTR